MRLSFTKLNLFEFCPWAYRYRYVERIPTPFSPGLVAGAAVHAVLRQFFELLRSGATADLSELISLYNSYWDGAPRLDPARHPDIWDRGLKLLKGYWAAKAARPGRPLLLEARFRILLGPEDGHTVEGVIDRVDVVDGGAEIIDYKSGIRPDRLPPALGTQLHIYAIAAKRQFALNPVRLTAYFLGDNHEFSAAPDPAFINDVKMRLSAMAAAIAERRFGATPGPQCTDCDYAGRCPYRWAASV